MYLPKYPPLELRISSMLAKKDREIVRDCLMPLLHVPNRNSIVRPRQQGEGLTPNFRSTPPPLKHIRQGSPIHRLSFVHYDSVKHVVSSQNEPTFLYIFRVEILDHLLTCASLRTQIRRGSICFAAKSQKLFATLASEFS